jgi:hypothetical protein
VTYLWIALSDVTIGLQAALAIVLFYKGRREFPLLFSYVLARAGLGIALLLDFYSLHARGYDSLYWLSDIGLHGLVFALLVHLIRCTLVSPPRYILIAGLISLPVLVFLSMAVPYHNIFNRWMTGFSRNLSFCEEILNLVLWGLLVHNRRVGLRFLLVSAGLGIQVTGEVTGQSLRLFTHSAAVVWAPNLLVNAGGILAILLWLYAFCRSSPNDKYSSRMSYAATTKAH